MAGEQLARSSQLASQQASQGNRMLFEGLASAPARALEAAQQVHGMHLQQTAVDIKKQQLAEEHAAYLSELQTRQVRAQTALLEQEVAKGQLVIDRFEAETKRAAGERRDRLKTYAPEWAGRVEPNGKGGWRVWKPNPGGDQPLISEEVPEKYHSDAARAYQEQLGGGKGHQPIKEEDPTLGMQRLLDVLNSTTVSDTVAERDPEKAAMMRELRDLAKDELARRRKKSISPEDAARAERSSKEFAATIEKIMQQLGGGKGSASEPEAVPADVQQAGVDQAGWDRARAAGRTPEMIRAHLKSRGLLK